MNRRARAGDEAKKQRIPLYFSLGLHVSLFLVVVLANVAPEPVQLVAIDLELVAMPAPRAEPEPAPRAEEDLTVDTPLPEEVPEEEPEAVVEREEEPVPEPEALPDAPEPVPEPEVAEEEPEPAPMDEPNTGADALDARMRGVERDFPRYYANMQAQLRRCFNRSRSLGSRSDRTASVDFVLNRDGKVIASTMRISEPSGSFAFDVSVMEAVECAGNGRFDPLPSGMGEPAPFRFTFSPARRPSPERPS